MFLIDRAAAWNPVPVDRPGRVWLPADPHAGGAPTWRPDRPPQPITVTLSAADAHHLPHRLDDLLSQAEVGQGDAVTVDLTSATSVHLTGLGLLLTVLWRRVGASGDVTLVGGTPSLTAQLSSLGITPEAARAGVHGPLPAAPARPAPGSGRASTNRPSTAVLPVPAPRRRSDAPAVTPGPREPALAGVATA